MSCGFVQVEKLRGTLKIEHTLADHGARKLWKLMKQDPYVPALGALSGNQAMQMVKGGLKAIYCSGWQVRSNPASSLCNRHHLCHCNQRATQLAASSSN